MDKMNLAKFKHDRSSYAKLEASEFFIPDIKLVGYGRSQTYQIVCLKCEKLEFNLKQIKDIGDLFCSSCVPDFSLLKEDNLSNVNFVGNILGWEIKSTGESKKRTQRNYKKVYERDRYTCRYCEYSLATATEFRPLHIDHVRPWSAAGSNKMDNLVVACSTCNLCASDKWFNSLWEKRVYIRQKLNLSLRDQFSQNNEPDSQELQAS